MDKQEYEITLKEKIEQLETVRKDTLAAAHGVITENLYYETFFFAAAMNRCTALIDGMKLMLQNRNLECAVILLRAQIDNCMRVFAAFIAQDKSSFMKKFLNGIPIRNMIANDGKKMTDKHLRERMAVYDKKLDITYEAACGYVHLSDSALKNALINPEDKKADLAFTIGVPLKEEANEELLVVAETFLYYVRSQNTLFGKVAEAYQGHYTEKEGDPQ